MILCELHDACVYISVFLWYGMVEGRHCKKNIATLPACLGYALRPLQLFNTRTHCLKKTIKIRYFFAYLFSHTCENIFRCTEKEIQGCRSTDFPLTVAFLTHNIYWVRDANDEQVRWYKKNKTRERTVKGYCKNTLYFFCTMPYSRERVKQKDLKTSPPPPLPPCTENYLLNYIVNGWTCYFVVWFGCNRHNTAALTFSTAFKKTAT